MEVASFLKKMMTNRSRMKHNQPDSEHGAYSYSHMQQKLQKYFEDIIIETEINGKPNVVTSREKAKAVLHDFYSQQKADLDTEK